MTRMDWLLPATDVSVLGGPNTSVEEYVLNRCLQYNQGLQGEHKDQADAAVLARIAPATTSGLQLYEQARYNLQCLPTGCRLLDRLLDGEGLRQGCVLEITGPSASGKTQLCHCFVAETAARGEGVVYVDTTNSFSPQRVCQLADSARSLSPSTAPLDHIQVVRVHSVHKLLQLLEDLTSSLSEASLQGPRPVALIVDSVSAVVSPVLGSLQHFQGHALMTAVGRALKGLATTHHLAVLVTNHVTAARRDDRPEPTGAAGSTDNMMPALGEAWRPMPHVRVQLHMPEDAEGVRQATLVNSGEKATGERGWFRILPSGLIDAEYPDRC